MLKFKSLFLYAVLFFNLHHSYLHKEHLSQFLNTLPSQKRPYKQLQVLAALACPVLDSEWRVASLLHQSTIAPLLAQTKKEQATSLTAVYGDLLSFISSLASTPEQILKARPDDCVQKWLDTTYEATEEDLVHWTAAAKPSQKDSRFNKLVKLAATAMHSELLKLAADQLAHASVVPVGCKGNNDACERSIGQYKRFNFEGVHPERISGKITFKNNRTGVFLREARDSDRKKFDTMCSVARSTPTKKKVEEIKREKVEHKRAKRVAASASRPRGRPRKKPRTN